VTGGPAAPGAALPVLLAGDGAGARPLPAAALADPPPEGPVLPLAGLVRPELRAAVAVVLGAPVGPDTTPDAAYLAVAAAFLGLRVDAGRGAGALLVGEHLLPDPGAGPVRMQLDGERVAEVPVELPGSLPRRLAELAASGCPLAAGQLVLLLLPAPPVPARAGALLLTGPGGRSLLARLTDGDGSEATRR
jgi:hypothetical protein